MTCKKRGYYSETAAKTALANTLAVHKGREDTKYYRCSRCKKWHLTLPQPKTEK